MKPFQTISFFLPILAPMYVYFGCASFDPALQSEFEKVQVLENQQTAVRKEYLLVLGQLKKFPQERPLILRHAELKQRLLEIEVKLKEEQNLFADYLKTFEKGLVEDRIEKDLIEREIRK